jgi:hypothetical protein
MAGIERRWGVDIHDCRRTCDAIASCARSEAKLHSTFLRIHVNFSKTRRRVQHTLPGKRYRAKCTESHVATTTGLRASSTSPQYLFAENDIVVRPAQSAELAEVAWLRAEAYYEVQPLLLNIPYICMLDGLN